MNIRTISPELSKIAANELNEDPARTEQDVKALKEWLNKQSHLVSAKYDDQWLIAFLRGCKFSLERAKEKLDMYYTLRSANPEMCQLVDPMDPLIQEILSVGAIVVLPNIVKPGDPRVMIIRPGRYNPERITITNMAKMISIISFIQLLEDDDSVISGQRYVADLDGFSMGHFAQMTPSTLKKIVMATQDGLPFRQKGSHNINTPPGVETIFNIINQFMTEKNRSRFIIHNKDMEGLYKYIPKSILPTEYGGDAGPIQAMIDMQKKKIESYRDLILKDIDRKSDESKRVGKPKTAETLFGIEGSFRQLNVD